MSTWDIQAYAIFYDSNAFPECPDYIGGHYWPLQYLINYQWIVGSSYDRNQKVYGLYKLYHLSVIMKSHSSPKSATKCFINDPFFSRQKTWLKRTAFPFQELHRKTYSLSCLFRPSEAHRCAHRCAFLFHIFSSKLKLRQKRNNPGLFQFTYYM